jgi:hypothetical protein
MNLHFAFVKMKARTRRLLIKELESMESRSTKVDKNVSLVTVLAGLWGKRQDSSGPVWLRMAANGEQKWELPVTCLYLLNIHKLEWRHVFYSPSKLHVFLPFPWKGGWEFVIYHGTHKPESVMT